MASIRQAAQDVLYEAKNEIAWIAVWKDGKGWMTMAFWPDVPGDHEELAFESYELEMLRNILKVDPNAVIVNGYYDNLGSSEEMTRDSLAAVLRWQYEIQNERLADHIGAITE